MRGIDSSAGLMRVSKASTHGQGTTCALWTTPGSPLTMAMAARFCCNGLLHDRTPWVGPDRNRGRGCGAFDREMATRGLLQCVRCGLMRVTEEQWEWLQERAAIMEYEGHLARDDAERQAFELLRNDISHP